MDKHKYKDAHSLEIHIIPDEKNNTLSIVDNGVGMTRHDLMTGFRSYEYPPRYLNTIKKYLTYEASADLSPIYKLEPSEWGLGFFSAYMVADKVVVTTRMQGDDPFVWKCKLIDNVVSTFSVAAAPVDDSFVHGTKVTLHLKPGHDQYLRVDKLQELVNKYKRLRHFYPILVFPNGKNEPGILLNEKEEEEPIEKLKQQYEDIRLLFVEYIRDRAKNVDVVISDRPRMGVFCNLDVFDDGCKRPVLEINPRCYQMKELRKMLECLEKFKELESGEMVESGEKFKEERGEIVESRKKFKEAVSLHTKAILETIEKFKEERGEMVESGEKKNKEHGEMCEKFKEEFGEIVEEYMEAVSLHSKKMNGDQHGEMVVSGDTNDEKFMEAVSLPKKRKNKQAVSYARKMKKEAAVKRMILQHFERSLSRIRLYDCLHETSLYKKAVEAIGH